MDRMISIIIIKIDYIIFCFKVCDHPWNVDCDGLYPSSTTTTTDPGCTTDPPTTTTPTTRPPPPTCPPPPICPPPTCPPPDPIPEPCECGEPLPHKTDCDKFWLCIEGKKVLVTCSEGLHFNAKIGTCDYISNARCVRSHVQATAQMDGLKIFLPWDQVDEDLRNTYQIQ